MKMITKICLAAAAVAGSLGILGIGAGMAMGADMDDLAELREHGIYIGGSGFFVGEKPNNNTPTHGSFVAEKEAHETDEQNAGQISETIIEAEPEANVPRQSAEVLVQTQNQDYNKEHIWEFDSALIQSLDVEIEQGTVNIYVNNTDNRIICGSNEKQLHFEQDEGTLEAEIHAKMFQDLTVDFYLPPDVLQEIDMEFGSCTVYIEALAADEISLSVGAGRIIVDCLKTTTGAELQAGAGSVDVNQFSGNRLELECGMGDMYIACEGIEEEYNYSLECGAGSISIGDDLYSGLGQEIRLDNGAAKYVNAECGLGNIRLDFE